MPAMRCASAICSFVSLTACAKRLQSQCASAAAVLDTSSHSPASCAGPRAASPTNCRQGNAALGLEQPRQLRRACSATARCTPASFAAFCGMSITCARQPACQLATKGRVRRYAPVACQTSARLTPPACGSARQRTAPAHRAQGPHAPGPSTGSRREVVECKRQEHAPADGTRGPTGAPSTCAACARAAACPTQPRVTLARTAARHAVRQPGFRTATANACGVRREGRKLKHSRAKKRHAPNSTRVCALVWSSGVQRSAGGGAGPHVAPRCSRGGACHSRDACGLRLWLARCADGAERLGVEERVRCCGRSDRGERSRAGDAGLQGSGCVSRARAPPLRVPEHSPRLAAPSQNCRRLRPRLRFFWLLTERC